MAIYDPTKPISPTNNPESVSGNVATEQMITGESLLPIPSVSFSISQPQLLPSISSLSIPTFEATEPEKQASDLSSEIQRLSEQLIGQTEFRTQQETALSIPDIR